MKIKNPSAAGKFYTDNEAELTKQLDNFFKNSKKTCEYFSRAIIVPHAGYIYSGKLAAEGFQYLDKNAKTVFIIAPPHYVAVKDVSLSSYDVWKTPLGKIEVNQEINQELIKDFGCKFQDEAFAQEHSAEVQVPFIQKLFKNVKIVPILSGNPQKTADIIEKYWENTENTFIISSDLSHFNHSNEAKRLDEITAQMIELNMSEKINPAQACGSVGIKALGIFSQKKNYSIIRTGMYNSGDVTNDLSSVVGYGSWFLYAGEKNEFLKDNYSKIIIDICKKSIFVGLNKKSISITGLPAVFDEKGACFVTLEKNNELRGCIGSIIAHQSLLQDLIHNSQNAAFSDPRFPQLKKDEFNHISINVSLLSEPVKMNFKDEQDLLNQIKPFEDGIIIKDKNYQAVYLPSVWEQLPDKNLFLKSLKIKAGMPPEHFSKSFEAFRFYTVYIQE